MPADEENQFIRQVFEFSIQCEQVSAADTRIGFDPLLVTKIGEDVASRFRDGEVARLDARDLMERAIFIASNRLCHTGQVNESCCVAVVPPECDGRSDSPRMQMARPIGKQRFNHSFANKAGAVHSEGVLASINISGPVVALEFLNVELAECVRINWMFRWEGKEDWNGEAESENAESQDSDRKSVV